MLVNAMSTGISTIPGIYHYCDQWCERCLFTNQCSFFQDNFSVSDRNFDSPASADTMRELTLASDEYFREILRKDNLHPDDVREGKWVNEKTFPLAYGAAYKQQSLYRLSLYYGITMNLWLSEHLPMEELEKNFLGKIEFVIKPAEEILQQWQQVRDHLEVVSRMTPMIHAKLARALLSRVKNDRWQIQNNLPKDSDGSAKVATRLVSQSVESLKVLYELLPTQQDLLLTLLSTLQKVADEIKNEFPEAEQFIRPGFDEFASVK